VAANAPLHSPTRKYMLAMLGDSPTHLQQTTTTTVVPARFKGQLNNGFCEPRLVR
jgi:hypothetical protein